MKLSIPYRALIIAAMVLGTIALSGARMSRPGSSRPLDDADPDAQKAIIAHNMGHIRATFSNWGECANPDGVPGYKGFEFPINSGNDFLFSAGVWVGAQVDGQRHVTTGTDGDNGTNEFYPVHIGVIPSENAVPNFGDWWAASDALDYHEEFYYVQGARGIDDDSDWNVGTDDLDGNLHPSQNYDGGSGILNFDDDLDGLIDEEMTNGIDDDGDGLVDEDTYDGDINGDHDAGYDPEPHVDEDPAGNMAADWIDNDHDGLVDAQDPDLDGDCCPASRDDDGDGALDEDAAARAPQEFYCVYQDSISPQFVGSPDPESPHHPLQITVNQRSYAWTSDIGRDLVLLEITVKNTGVQVLEDVQLAFFADADVGAAGEGGDQASLDDSTYYDPERQMMVTTDSNTDADGPSPGLIAVKVVKPPIPWESAQFTYANFERVSGGDPATDVDKYNLISSGTIAPASDRYGDWRMLMGWGSQDGSLTLMPGDALEFAVAMIGAADIAHLNVTADRLPVFDTGPNIGAAILYTSPFSLGPYILSSPLADNDGVNYTDGVHINWLWRGHETAWSSAPPYSYVWWDPETGSGDYYFMLPDTHANGSAVALGDTILFYCDGEDGFGNYSAHTAYMLIAGVAFLGAHEPAAPAHDFALHQNYPNPFNATTTIRYDLPKATRVKLEVFNITGQRVALLVDAEQSAGSHDVSWNGQAVSSGVYIYRVEASGSALSRKMLLLK
jgi:hypothetical protein